MSLDKVNEYAKVSKLTVDQNGGIISGELIEDGSGKYEVFVPLQFLRIMDLRILFS